MILSLFILFEIIMIVGFCACYYLRNVLFWTITIVLSGVLMISSFGIERTMYLYNSTLTAYQPTVISTSYPYLATINIIFFALALIFGIYDIVTQQALSKKEDSF
jgi:hypothetical protein